MEKHIVAPDCDLSIDNVISNKDGVHIIDWEHFSLEGAPFGFDAYNLLFEQLWFSMKERKRPSLLFNQEQVMTIDKMIGLYI